MFPKLKKNKTFFRIVFDPFFFFSDKLGPTVFAPVKMDLVGNIKVNIKERGNHSHWEV